MIEALEYKGRWRVPNDDTWYDGVLKFDPIEGVSLEVFGTFNPGMFDKEIKQIILGETTKGDITLVDNHSQSNSHTFDSGVTIGV